MNIKSHKTLLVQFWRISSAAMLLALSVSMIGLSPVNAAVCKADDSLADCWRSDQGSEITMALPLTIGMQDYSPLDVVISEVAWAGTQASSFDEWIELYNNTNMAIDLTGWTLRDGGDIYITLSGTIPANGFYLLERTDNNTVSDIVADGLYTGALNNTGESLTLHDPALNVIDTANSNGGTWAAGTSSPLLCSMERINALLADTDTNWATNNNITRNGLDANGASICGTPKNENSASLQPTPTPTSTSAPTETLVPPTATDEPTSTPTSTPTATDEPTSTPTSTPTATDEPTSTPTSTPTATDEPTSAPTETLTPKPTVVANRTPVANAGGPYSAHEGTTIHLSAKKSTDPDKNITKYEWDLDNDGEFDDATGKTPKFFAIDNGTYAVSVKVTDAGNLSNVDSAIVTVKNESPVITSLSFSFWTQVGRPVNARAAFKDAGVRDTFTATWKWGDGADSDGVANGHDVTGDHTYTRPGIYLVTITVKDKDGGVGQTHRLIFIWHKK